MQALPHSYAVTVFGEPGNNLVVRVENLPELQVAPPVQFDGPGDQWSPEELLMASIANCFVLSFRAIANASKLAWSSIECESEGKLEKIDKNIRFTRVDTRVKLLLPLDANADVAGKLLEKAEASCFISNSLSCERHLEYDITISEK